VGVYGYEMCAVVEEKI